MIIVRGRRFSLGTYFLIGVGRILGSAENTKVSNFDVNVIEVGYNLSHL